MRPSIYISADTREPIYKTCRRVVASLAGLAELKCSNGSADRSERLLADRETISHPAKIETIECMGKEVIVDPIDTGKELTTELPNATEPLVY